MASATRTAVDNDVLPYGATTPFGSRPLRTFALAIAFPAFLVYVASAVLVIYVLSMMADEINRLDDARTRQAISAASLNLLRGLSDAAGDEGTWNEAYLNAVLGHDAAWLDGTWGSTARIGDSYDNVMVTDQTGTIFFGENNAGPITGNIADRIADALMMLDELDTTIAAEGDSAVISHFTSDADGIAAIASISIHRSTPGEMTVPGDARRILWLVKHLDPSVMLEVAKNYQVPLPALTSAPLEDQLSVPLVEIDGTVAGRLAWTPLHPGDEAFTHALLVASAALFAIGAMIVVGLRMLRRALVRRAENVEIAFTRARHDAATGRMNSFGLIEALGEMIAKAPAPKSAALALLGVDEYDQIRDTHGPEIAEQLMVKIGKLVGDAMGSEGLLARVAENSFAIGAVGVDAAATVGRLATSAKDALAVAAPIDVDGVLVEPKLSIGVATGVGDEVKPAQQIRTAQAAMHEARSTGSREAVTYDIAHEDDRKRRAEMVKSLRSAISTDEIEVEYQPIFDLRSQSLIGVEALLRWKRAGGVVSGGELMPVAQEAGLIHDLGIMALRRAARDILPLKGLMLAVNVATAQFEDQLFPEKLRAVLAATMFPAARLQMEIDQSLLGGRPHRASAIIDDLHAAGVVVALDDFVVGQSSLGYLRQFTLDRVKLARSLVSGVDSDKTKLALVEATVNIARSAGVAITATGVERKEEAAKLLKLGCSEFQGFLFAKPMSLDALHKLIASSGQPMKKAS